MHLLVGGGTSLKGIPLILLAFTLSAHLFAPASGYAQTHPPRFARLISEDGLSYNMVRCILQDNEGFMWFGTQNGLNKYDGYAFTVYRHHRSDPDSLSSSYITALYQDRSGTLWIGTVAGLDSFSGGAAPFTHYPAISEEIGVIYEDAGGMLWIGTVGSGLFRYDRVAGQFVHYEPDAADVHGLSSEVVLSIHEDGSGRLWVGTGDRGFYAFDPAAERFVPYQEALATPHSLSHDRVTAIYEDRSGLLWIGTGSAYDVEVGGLNAFEGGTFAQYLHDAQNRHSLSNNHVRSIYQDRTGTLWIGTDDGLNVFDRATDRFLSYHHDPLDPHSLSDNTITCIYEDRMGTLWFGTDGAGVNKYARVKDRFARFQPNPLGPDTLSGPAIGALYEDQAGVLWMGVAGEGLDRLDRRTGQFAHYSFDANDPHSLSNNNVRALFQDHEGVLWVGTNRGLDRLDLASGDSFEEGAFTHYIHDPDDPGSLSPGAVKAIMEDHTRALWVATEEPGSINRFDRSTETFTRYAHDPDDPDSFINTYGVRAIYEDRAGDLWLGTYDGLVHFDRDRDGAAEGGAASAGGAFTHYENDPEDPTSLSHDFVWSIYEDPAGNLWIATGEGLNRFDRATGQFLVYTTEDGLANDNVMCILADEQGRLWLGTDGGLSTFDPATEAFKNYDVGDGLTSNEILLGACHRSETGEMFFGTLDGFNAFYPTDVQDNPHVPPVVLTAFRKFDEVVEFDTPLSDVDEITLSYEDNFFAFEFAALDFTEPAKNQYAYKLEGFGKDWIYCGTRRYASYTSVPPGKYTFRVKGTNNDGLWNEGGRAINITITPPFWETWWFRILAVVMVAGVVGVVVRNRLRNIAILRESEERFRTLFENAPLCVFELDMTYSPARIIRANQESERTFGWSAAEFATTSLDRIFPAGAQPNVQRLVDSVNVGQTATMESTGLRRDGTEFPIRLSATGEPGPGLKQAILAVEDITAEKERRSEEEAIAEERRRIAREIHDGLAQDLAGLRFRVGLWHDLVNDDPAQMHAELDGLRDLLSRNIREVRRSIFALRPVVLDELGFYPALREFITEFGEQNQVHIDLRIEGPPERLPAFLEPVLFRIIQESLNNVSRHAQAGMAWIVLDLVSPVAVSLSVRDDGVGFDPAHLEPFAQRRHLGLKQMRERVERRQGRFEIHSQAGQGTEIRAVLPLEEGKR
jgi:PAS domain S-box-containing protein